MQEKKVHLLETKNLGKKYGKTTVLSEVNFTLDKGETVAVIGQNGAGKSTFSKIIAGVIEPTEGEVFLEGKKCRLFPPRNALRSGIVFIPQELAYVPELTVAENIMLGHLPGRGGMVSYQKLYKETEKLLRENEIPIDIHRKMDSLKLGEKQLVEIAKALAKNAKIILLDEPTASLTDVESKNLFRIVGKLAKEKGVGILYISHRMDEVFRFSDRVDVFRNGRLVASEKTKESNHEKLIFYMLGQESEALEQTEVKEKKEVLLKVKSWTSKTLPTLNEVSFDVCKGEVLCLFGVRGCGYEKIAEGMVGISEGIDGSIEYKGNERKLFKSILEAKKQKVAYVPPDRKKQGLFLEQSIMQNSTVMVLKELSKLGFVSKKKSLYLIASMADRFKLVFQGYNQKVSELSGGNQQKVLLGSRLGTRPELFVLQEPTRGVDIGARLEIHRQLKRIAADGAAVVIVTSDIEEAVSVSDKMIVLRDGKVTGKLLGAEKTEQEALRLASGNEN